MMSKTRCALFAGALSAAVVGSADAGLIDTTYSGVGSGRWLNGIYAGQTFTSKAFTFYTQGLTSGVSGGPSAFTAANGFTRLTLEGYGDIGVNSITNGWVNNTQGRGGLTVSGQGDLFGFANQAFYSWNMGTSLGPISGLAVFNTQPLFTVYGAILFSGSATVTLTSTVVPAPSAVALLGLVGAVGARRRRA